MAGAGERYLIFGGTTGWIGQKLVALLRGAGKDVVCAASRLDRPADVEAELDAVRPTRVLNAAGLTGRPNVDWCEDHKDEVIRVNVIGTLALLDACERRGIHVTNFATG
jgi:3,5-epimerase/4-reductase